MWCRRRELLLSMGGLSLTSCRDNASERTVAYGSHPAQTYNLYKPSGAGNRRLIVLIHGGGWHQGSREDTAWLVPRLLPEGYTVANLGYRQLADAPAPAAAED